MLFPRVILPLPGYTTGIPRLTAELATYTSLAACTVRGRVAQFCNIPWVESPGEPLVPKSVTVDVQSVRGSSALYREELTTIG